MELELTPPILRNVWKVTARGCTSGDRDLEWEADIYVGDCPLTAQRTLLELLALSSACHNRDGDEHYSSIAWPLLEGRWTGDPSVDDYSLATPGTPFAWAVLHPDLSDPYENPTLWGGDISWFDEHGAEHVAKPVLTPSEQTMLREASPLHGVASADRRDTCARLLAAWQAHALSRAAPPPPSRPRPGL